VYRPLAPIVPAPVAGAIVHVTLWFAVNCWLPPPVNVTDAGLTASAGTSVTVAVVDCVVSAALVAVIVTVCCVVIAAGAVYSPLVLIVPAPVAGVIVHVTL
jgi:hypothetical protein